MTSEIDLGNDVPEDSRIIGTVVVTLVEPPQGESLITVSRGLNQEFYDQEMLPVTAITMLNRALESLKEEQDADDVV